MTSDLEMGSGWGLGVLWVAGVCPEIDTQMKCCNSEFTFEHPWPSLIQRE